MQIKRFEAKNMTTALRLIKDELGPDAVILSARSLRKGKGIFGSMKYAGVEVSAASDNRRLPMGNSMALSRKSIDPNWGSSRLKNSYQVGKKEAISPTGYAGQIPTDRQRYDSGKRSNSRINDKVLSSLYQLILTQEVDRSIASEIIEEIKHTPAPLGKLDGWDLKSHCTSILEEMGMMIDGDVFAAGNARIAAFIGCTGVGKTTTVAKLAAVQSRRYKKRVALITLDNYGIAAIKQLKTYARIIGIPLEAPVNTAELKRSIKKHKDKELIIIDTPGINPHNQELIQDLKDRFAKLSNLQTHLVLSATTKEKDLIATTKAFKEMNIHRLLFTKIDESCTYGNIVNLLIRTNIPLSFLCGGRMVPDDIEAGSTEKLVALLFKSQSGNSRQLADSACTPDDQAANPDMLPAVKKHSVGT
jgi:flagellar biosynthesis protein FlhF